MTRLRWSPASLVVLSKAFMLHEHLVPTLLGRVDLVPCYDGVRQAYTVPMHLRLDQNSEALQAARVLKRWTCWSYRSR